MRNERESQAEKESTNADLDDELDDDLNNFGNVFQEVQNIYAQSNSVATQTIFQAGKKSKSSQIEEASKERRGKNKIFAHIQKEIETKENNKPKLNENDQVLDLCTSSEC